MALQDLDEPCATLSYASLARCASLFYASPTQHATSPYASLAHCCHHPTTPTLPAISPIPMAVLSAPCTTLTYASFAPLRHPALSCMPTLPAALHVCQVSAWGRTGASVPGRQGAGQPNRFTDQTGTREGTGCHPRRRCLSPCQGRVPSVAVEMPICAYGQQCQSQKQQTALCHLVVKMNITLCVKKRSENVAICNKDKL